MFVILLTVDSSLMLLLLPGLYFCIHLLYCFPAMAIEVVIKMEIKGKHEKALCR